MPAFTERVDHSCLSWYTGTSTLSNDKTETTMKQFKDLDISGPDKQLLALIETVSANLPADWHRDPEAEARMEHLDFLGTGVGFAFIRDAKEGAPKAGLFLSGERERLNVPNIVPLDSSELSMIQYNKILDEFADMLREHALPDAQLNICLTSDDAAITDWVSSDAAGLLEHFSKLANKSTGSAHPLDFERWARFLIQVHKEGSTLYSSFLSQWLVEELGWSPDHANRLARDYEFARDLLRHYDRFQ